MAKTKQFTAGVPDDFTITADGMVLFLRSRAGDDSVNCLWRLDPATGAETLVADPLVLLGGTDEELSQEEKTRRERSRERGSGIVGYTADAEGKVAAFALSGDLWAVQRSDPKLLATAGKVMDPWVDPTGRRIAYVCDGGLRVISVDGSADQEIAAVDGPEVTFGLPEHVAAESMGRHRGYWWAPGGERLLVSRVDNSPVMIWWISDPADPASAPRAMRYPATGSTNAEVTLWIMGLDGSRVEVDWDREAFEYVTAAGWDAHGPYAAVQSRDQGTVHLLQIDPETGSTSVIGTQTDPHWVQLVPGLPCRTGSGALVWHADIGETRHLSIDGEPVTPAGLQLSEVVGIEDDRVLFLASADPLEMHLWLYEPGQEIRQLTSEPGVHYGVSRYGTLIHVAKTLSRPGRRVTLRRDSLPPLELVNHQAQPVVPIRVTGSVVGARSLRTHLFLPSWHEPGAGRLPILVDPYGGSAMQKVTAQQAGFSFTSQWFAEQGFAVLVTDGSGTPGRGPVWEREVYGDMFTTVLDDQITALTEVAQANPDLDLGRVAIRGWSFGGSLAALAVLRRPDVFHAAIAGAGVSDQRLYDSHWRERFLGHPDRFPEHYDACSLLLEAPKLGRPLLLVHGMADDNVFPANTLQLSHALLAAGRPHEVLPLSRATHSGGELRANLMLHELDFLRRSLPAGEAV
jgi:dipeptidyl-peptidase-4